MSKVSGAPGAPSALGTSGFPGSLVPLAPLVSLVSLVHLVPLFVLVPLVPWSRGSFGSPGPLVPLVPTAVFLVFWFLWFFGALVSLDSMVPRFRVSPVPVVPFFGSMVALGSMGSMGSVASISRICSMSRLGSVRPAGFYRLRWFSGLCRFSRFVHSREEANVSYCLLLLSENASSCSNVAELCNKLHTLKLDGCLDETGPFSKEHTHVNHARWNIPVIDFVNFQRYFVLKPNVFEFLVNSFRCRTDPESACIIHSELFGKRAISATMTWTHSQKRETPLPT